MEWARKARSPLVTWRIRVKRAPQKSEPWRKLNRLGDFTKCCVKCMSIGNKGAFQLEY